MKLIKLAAFALLALAAWPARLPVRAEARPPLAVVVGSELKLSEISLATLRTIFRGDPTTAPDGKRFLPLNAPLKSFERELFDRKVLGLAPDEVAQFWITRRIRDEGLPPRTLPSSELGLRVVASYPGAITYVSTKIVKGGVRVLKVDGKLPTDAGYLLSAP
ncbi:MAG: hypothetical protein ABW352_21940 [Polyangiales bacterium]